MTHSVTLNVQVKGLSERYAVLGALNKLASELPDDVDHMVSSYKLPENAPSERYEELCYDEKTLCRVLDVLRQRVTAGEAQAIVTDLSQAGILFRERPL